MKLLTPSKFVPSWILSRRISSFQKFFELGQEESASPFLDAQAKKISANIALKSALLSTVFLIIAFSLQLVFEPPFWAFFLIFVYLLAGTPALIAAADDVIFRHDVNIDVLTTLAAFVALSIGRSMEGALLLVLFALAGSLEDLVTLKAKSALSAINELTPTKAYVVEEGGFLLERAVDDVKVGDVVAIRSGELIPLDGIVKNGASSISTAHLTGESRPLYVQKGDTVVSGAKVLEGSLEVAVSVTSHDSTVSKLISLITRAHTSRPKLSQAFEQFGKIYALSVISITALLMFFLPMIASIPFFGDEGSLLRALSFLITASPCALILAVPITYLSALGASVHKGAILKGSVVLDNVLRCPIVAFDKTGTLTEGTLQLVQVMPLSKTQRTEEEVIAIAAALERNTVHPLAHAVVESFSTQRRPYPTCTDVQVKAGQGVEGNIEGLSVFIGNAPVATTLLPQSNVIEIADQERKKGHVVAVLVIDKKEGYLLSFSDQIRKESVAVIKELHEQKKQIFMLTGDHKENAFSIASVLSIDNVYAELTPEAKLSLVTALSQETGLLMVGDGINDAPALARATVGVSMGQLSSASAREASDIVLLHNNLHVLSWLFLKAASTRRIITQNLVVAVSSILIGTLASLQGFIPLWLAVLIHEGSTLIVGINALRVLSVAESFPPGLGQKAKSSK